MLQTKIAATLVAAWLLPAAADQTRHLVQVDQCPVVAECCEEDCCGEGTSWDLDTLYCVTDHASSGFNGTYSSSYAPGCVERVCCQADCCGDGLQFDQGLAVCVPPGSPPTGAPTGSPTAAPTSTTTNVTYFMRLDGYERLGVMKAVEMHQQCLDGRNVFLERFTDSVFPVAPYKVMVCPAQDMSKEGNTYRYTLFNNRSITVTCPPDSGYSDCIVKGDGLMLDVGEVCWLNTDCVTNSCIQPTNDTNMRVTSFCTCHPLSHKGCDEGFICSYEFNLLPKCLLPMGAECSSDESCSTFHCDDETSACACNKDTDYPCDVLRGESCELAEGSYMCLGREPTPSPTSYPDLECQPTVGPCVSTFDQLKSVVAEAESTDVIALCGNGIPLVTESEIIIDKSGMMLCCLGTQECIMASSGGGRNLLVTGSDFTVQDIIFINGTGRFEDGGNMAIDATGNHRIIGCEFHNGESPGHTFGGNLAVKNADNLVMKECLFADGSANTGGGAHLDAKKWIVDGCTFRNNSCSGDGGGIHTWLAEEISIKNSVFESNSGWTGGGFFASGMGSLRSLEILGTTFNDNVAGSIGGAAQLRLAALRHLDLTFSGNIGAGNVAMEYRGCLEFGLAYYEQPHDNTCVGIEDEISNVARESSSL